MLVDHVRIVLFDAVGSLIHPQPSAAVVYRDVAWQLGVRLSEEVIERRFRCELARDRADTAGEATDVGVERHRWRSIVRRVLPELGRDVERAFERLWWHFGRAENWRVYAGVAPLWHALHQRGLTLGVASNFDQRLEGMCPHLPPLDLVSHVFHSAGVGFRKPDPRFFREVQRRVKIAADRIMLVGDDPDDDVRGATAAGWQAFRIDSQFRQQSLTALWRRLIC